VATIRAYFDDSSDDKRQRFATVGGLIGHPLSWERFDSLWATATYGLSGPFHATDCDTNPPRGVFKGWTKERADALMKRLVKVILESRMMGLGTVVPIPEYHQAFPDAQEHDPYLLALRHTVINMGQIGRELGENYPDADGVKMWFEDGDTSGESLRIYQALKAMPEWKGSTYLRGFSVGNKSLQPLQGADLLAREAFKHADNMGKLPTRKPVWALKDRISFHFWTAECLQYLKENGGPDNLTALTEWGNKRPPEIPVMTNFYKDSFK
jgi:hypothetical protein